jgi:hypothetical protein
MKGNLYLSARNKKIYIEYESSEITGKMLAKKYSLTESMIRKIIKKMRDEHVDDPKPKPNINYKTLSITPIASTHTVVTDNSILSQSESIRPDYIKKTPNAMDLFESRLSKFIK